MVTPDATEESQSHKQQHERCLDLSAKFYTIGVTVAEVSARSWFRSEFS